MINDCPNGDMRDLLPELVHGRLDDATRAAVQAHLAGCADCRAEVELIWGAARSLSQVPKVDVRRIVAALPTPEAARARQARPTFRFSDLRRMAAVAAVAAGLLMVGIWQRGAKLNSHLSPRAPDSGTVAMNPPAAPPVASGSLDTPVAAPPVSAPTPPSDRGAPAPAQTSPTLAVGELDGLSSDQLESVLASLNDIDGIPSAEPDPVAVPTPLAGGARLQ